MTHKRVIVDPDNNYEIVDDSETAAREFNSHKSNGCTITAEDYEDLLDNLLDEGLLLEMSPTIN